VSHISRGVVAAKQWGRGFWHDYAERVGSVLLYQLITFFTIVMPQGNLSFDRVWPVLGLPVVLSALKGLLANMKNQGTGASLLPDPPGPVISDRGATTLRISFLIVMAALVASAIWPYLYAA